MNRNIKRKVSRKENTENKKRGSCSRNLIKKIEIKVKKINSNERKIEKNVG